MTGETKMEERLRVLEKDAVVTKTLLEQHVESCDRRNQLIFKIVCWALLGVVILVIEQTFNIHVPSNIPTL